MRLIGSAALVLFARIAIAGMIVGDGRGGQCAIDGEATAEIPQCTHAQTDAALAVLNDPVLARKEYVRLEIETIRRGDNRWPIEASEAYATVEAHALAWLYQRELPRVPCDRVILLLGGNAEMPVIAAVLCDTAQGQVLYEVLNARYVGGSARLRVTTREQVIADFEDARYYGSFRGSW